MSKTLGNLALICQKWSLKLLLLKSGGTRAVQKGAKKALPLIITNSKAKKKGAHFEHLNYHLLSILIVVYHDLFPAIKIKRSMKKIVFILLIFCSFLVVWGCNKNKTKCVPQKEATSDSSRRSNDDTLSLMIEHEVDDVDYGVIIKRGDKTIHRFGYKYPEDDDLVPNEERIDSCLLTDLNFDGIKEDVLFYLGSFGASGTKHFDAYVWNPNTEHYDKIEEFKDIPNPKISDKYKCILSRVYVSSAENEYAKYVCTNGHLIKVAELRQYWKGNIYPERDRAVYEEHFIKANVWKRNLKLNQISDFWKPVVPF